MRSSAVAGLVFMLALGVQAPQARGSDNRAMLDDCNWMEDFIDDVFMGQDNHYHQDGLGGLEEIQNQYPIEGVLMSERMIGAYNPHSYIENSHMSDPPHGTCM